MQETEQTMKSIPGYEGLYSITRDGKVYSNERNGRKGFWVKLRYNTEYQRIPLHKDGVITFHHVHRLVAMTYIPNPQNKKYVNHKNCNKHDNSVENLEWTTWKENWEHARDHGKYKGIMLDEDKQIEIAQLYSTGKFTIKELAKMYNISPSGAQRFIKKHTLPRLAA